MSIFGGVRSLFGLLYFCSGISVDDAKIFVVRDWPTPTSMTEARSFHGLASFYSRFIPHFSSIITPITDTMHGKTFTLTSEANMAFELIKQKLTYAHVLILSDFSLPFELHVMLQRLG